MRTRRSGGASFTTTMIAVLALALACTARETPTHHSRADSEVIGDSPGSAEVGAGSDLVSEKKAVDGAVAGLEELTGRRATAESRALATQMFRVVRRMLDRDHIDEVGEIGDALRLRAIELMGTGKAASGTTSEGATFIYTIEALPSGFLHHISLSFAGGGLTVSTGRLFIHGLLRRYGLETERPFFAFSDRRVIHWAAIVDEPAQRRFMGGPAGPPVGKAELMGPSLDAWFERIDRIYTSEAELSEALTREVYP